MKKLTRKQAIKLFNEGITICLCSSKITPQIIQYSQWYNWYDFKKSYCDEQGETFDTVVNSFRYYNCDKERGLCVHYYTYC